MTETLPRVRIRLFGGVQALRGDVALPIGGRQERTLLALLVVHRRQPLTGERLVDLLWPDDPPATAAKAVQVYVSRLRAAIGPDVIERDGNAYRLTDAVDIETDAFEELVQDGLDAAADDPLVALEMLVAALRGANGEPFADALVVESIRTAAAGLLERRWQARTAWIDLLVRLGRVDRVLTALPAFVAEDPLREDLWAAWIRALSLEGRYAEALATFEAARTTLHDELGVPPGPALEALHAVVVSRADINVDRIRPPFVAHLPAQGAEFVGRASELASLEARLRPGGDRILNLTGPGGTGKTRLAVEVARRLVDAFNGAVAFVDIGGVREAEQLWPAIAASIGADGPPEGAIGGARALLVLDNPERITRGAEAVAELLQAMPRLQVIVATRVPVRVAGAATEDVAPLCPEDAAHLFQIRARAAGAPGEQADVVDAICERLDRLPLALELAALQARAFPGRDLLRALDRRLPALVGGAVGGPERHATIEATIDWSYALLDEPERQLFADLAVFDGGWTIAAAVGVCGATRDGLRALVDQSLIRRVGERLTMLDTLREFAAARLEASGRRPALLARHADFFLAEARRQASATDDGDGQYRILADDVENQRIAMATLCGEVTTDRALELAMLLWMTWLFQGRVAEGQTWFEQAAARLSPDTTHDRAEILSTGAEFPRVRGDLARAEAQKLEALRLEGPATSRRLRPATLVDLTEIALARDDLDAARTYGTEALMRYEQLGSRMGIVHAAATLADVEARSGNVEAAATLLEAHLPFLREAGLTSRVAGQFGAYVPIQLGRIRVLQGELGIGRALIVEGLAAARRMGMLHAEIRGLEATAALALASGRVEVAAHLLGAVRAIRRRHGMADDTVAERAPVEGGVTENLGVAAAGAARAFGETLSVDSAMDLAQAMLVAELT